MKKNIILLTIAACALFACHKNEIELLEKPIIEQIDGNTYSYTFSAIISDSVDEVDEDGTKATVSRAGAYTWAVNDELMFFKSDNTSANAKITAVDGSNATITVTTTDPRADFVSAIYPASAAVAKDQISFNARGPIVVSAVSGGTLAFHHIGSVINLKFTEIPAGTANLVFTPEASLGFDGKFSFEGRVPSLTSGASPASIVVPATTADEGKDITISVPSITLTDGFTVTLKNDSGRNLFKKTTEKTLDLSGGHKLLNMKKVACEAPSKFYVKTSASSSFDVTDARMLQTGTDEYTLFLNCGPEATYYIYDEFNMDQPTVGFIKSGKSVATSSATKWKGEFDSDDTWTEKSMMREGNWLYVKNTTFGKTWPGFKIDEDGSWGKGAYGASITGGYDTSNLYINNDYNHPYYCSYDSDNTKVSNFYLGDRSGESNANISTSHGYDLFLNTSTKEIKVLDTPASDWHVYKITLTSPHSAPSSSIEMMARQYSSDPFGDSNFPTTNYYIKGDWSGDWTRFATASSYSNLSWKISNFAPGTDGSINFGLQKYNGEESYWTALANNTISTVAFGGNLYGTLSWWSGYGQTNPSITLEDETYDIFINVNFSVQGGINVMFEKK